MKTPAHEGGDAARGVPHEAARATSKPAGIRPDNPRLWLAVFGASAVFYVLAGAMARKSPGPITTVHAGLPDIDGGASCSACHGGWTSTMAESCLSCHPAITLQLESGRGLHGRLGAAVAETCARCHSEHHGANFAIVNRQSFAMAGVKGPEGFDHGVVGLELQGAHVELGCAECHEHADTAVLEAGQHRYLGLDRNCASCHQAEHQRAHEGRMTLACDTCHEQGSFERLAAFDHDRHLPLRGGHADLSCAACHDPAGEHALAALGAGREPKRARGCADCHESPHAEAFLAGIAQDARHAQHASCALCHDADTGTFVSEGMTVTSAQHRHTGFPIDAPHAEAACVDCHGGEPGVADSLPRFRGTPRRCEQCHDDAHGGFFEARSPECAARLAAHDTGSCAHCHGTDALGAIPAGFEFDHGFWTGFEVTGAHAEAECAVCHPRTAEADPSGRTFGRVAAHFGEFQGCETCHQNPHGDVFARSPTGRREAGSVGCDTCHVEHSFRALITEFDHLAWTGFALHGAHGEAACSACHPSLRDVDPHGRSTARAHGSHCADCHADPHERQFVDPTSGRTDCRRCHASTVEFRELIFDHDRHARFQLGDAHAEVACAACHKATVQDGVEVVRYRPLAHNCADCHGTARNPLRAGERRGR